LSKILIVQTAFAGDVVLVTPLACAVKTQYPEAELYFLVKPEAAVLLENNPLIDHIWIYDKRGEEKGFRWFLKSVQRIRKEHIDLALVPHRSIRSALLVSMAHISRRVGFHRSAGFPLFTDLVRYRHGQHEIERNLELLTPLGWKGKASAPELYPGEKDREAVKQFLEQNNLTGKKMLAVSPGSVWRTKRWLPDRFAEVIRYFHEKKGIPSVLIGGREDLSLGHEISKHVPVANSMGQFSLLASAELIGQCSVILCNDSAPLHLAAAMGTPVVAIFGPTVPEFGFYPWGNGHTIIQQELVCRPCSDHGGTRCPMRHFACMKNIKTGQVIQAVDRIIHGG